ncbi:Bacterial periplasmic spermidine/putrescine-binding protein [Dioscorea alata]|uniref:Bacterial periplasmic spermidine/putrescine-binding protein n=1 Tax=Dioscorea alata TaxID=55571 RepID=A0ACB7WHD2_DIOAL|nr:Bacterial periplasmic spermidine/putrescine-binding protein [Dioscorea alata]
MAASLNWLPLLSGPNPNPNSRSPLLWIPSCRRPPFVSAMAVARSDSLPSSAHSLSRHSALVLQLAASSAFLLFGLRARACPLGSQPITPPTVTVSSDAKVDASENHASEGSDLAAQKFENEEFKTAFENFKAKTYALTVPLRIVALRGSIPPSWIKDFIQLQGRRLKLTCEFRANLESIFSDLSAAVKKGSLDNKSAMSADIVSIGDSWLSSAITGSLIEPIQHVEEQDWFKSLGGKWKSYLRRNNEGELDSEGYIWGAPYRWGSIVIAYKKSKFIKNNLNAIEDWGDLWRPELAGKISMVASPREVVGAVLKYMGASYNTEDLDSVVGGRKAAMHNLIMLQRQVRLFDDMHYLKAFGAGDVWVTVGWSSDVIPAAKRMSNVAVVVPKSGASLWADLWVVPSATKFSTDRLGGRVRGPSPLIHQWFEFCLQTARGLPFQQEVIPGASPSFIEQIPDGKLDDSTDRRPKLDTNLINGIPPPEILAKCEFLEPLPKKTLEDYQWLMANLQKPGYGWIQEFPKRASWVIAKLTSNGS